MTQFHNGITRWKNAFLHLKREPKKSRLPDEGHLV